MSNNAPNSAWQPMFIVIVNGLYIPLSHLRYPHRRTDKDFGDIFDRNPRVFWCFPLEKHISKTFMQKNWPKSHHQPQTHDAQLGSQPHELTAVVEVCLFCLPSSNSKDNSRCCRVRPLLTQFTHKNADNRTNLLHGVHFCLFSWHSGLVSLWPFSFVGGQKCWLMCWQCIRLAIGVYGHSHRSWWSHTWTPLTSRPYPCDKVRCPILGEQKSSATNSQVSRFFIETHRWMQKVSSLILQKRFRKSMANWASYAQKSKFTRTPVRIVG